jgi:hypothetical protein
MTDFYKNGLDFMSFEVTVASHPAVSNKWSQSDKTAHPLLHYTEYDCQLFRRFVREGVHIKQLGLRLYKHFHIW